MTVCANKTPQIRSIYALSTMGDAPLQEVPTLLRSMQITDSRLIKAILFHDILLHKLLYKVPNKEVSRPLTNTKGDIISVYAAKLWHRCHKSHCHTIVMKL